MGFRIPFTAHKFVSKLDAEINYKVPEFCQDVTRLKFNANEKLRDSSQTPNKALRNKIAFQKLLNT